MHVQKPGDFAHRTAKSGDHSGSKLTKSRRDEIIIVNNCPIRKNSVGVI